LFLVNRGRAYYVAPAYVVLLAAGCVGFESWLEPRAKKARRLGFGLLWGAQVIGSLIAIVLMKPIAPINSPLWEITSGINEDVVEMVGWPDLTEQVAKIYQSIPDEEKPRTAILAGNYGEAGALELYGGEYGLPRIISGSNSLWYRGYGEPEPETIIVVGFESSYAARFFNSCEYRGKVTNHYGVKNEETTYHTSLFVCRNARQPWSDMWQEMKWYQ
jgi:hypothetical protein